VVPCCYADAKTKAYSSHVIYSDDHGKTWRLGGSSPLDRTDESAVVELADGRLMLNMRHSGGEKMARMVCLSRTDGVTWEDQHYDETLVEPACQGSILRYSWPEQGGASRILFSNPADAKQRDKMTVRLSTDEGKTWPTARMLYAGPAAYSSLAPLPDGSIGCLYERGQQHPYQTITLALFSLDWLLGQRD
jgi:sialidase-1